MQYRYRYRECQKLKYARKPSKKSQPPQSGHSTTLPASAEKWSQQEAEGGAEQQKQSIGDDPDGSVPDNKDPEIENMAESSILVSRGQVDSVPDDSVVIKESKVPENKHPENKGSESIRPEGKIPEDKDPESKRADGNGPEAMIPEEENKVSKQKVEGTYV